MWFKISKVGHITTTLKRCFILLWFNFYRGKSSSLYFLFSFLNYYFYLISSTTNITLFFKGKSITIKTISESLKWVVNYSHKPDFNRKHIKNIILVQTWTTTHEVVLEFISATPPTPPRPLLLLLIRIKEMGRKR